MPVDIGPLQATGAGLDIGPLQEGGALVLQIDGSGQAPQGVIVTPLHAGAEISAPPLTGNLDAGPLQSGHGLDIGPLQSASAAPTGEISGANQNPQGVVATPLVAGAALNTPSGAVFLNAAATGPAAAIATALPNGILKTPGIAANTKGRAGFWPWEPSWLAYELLFESLDEVAD